MAPAGTRVSGFNSSTSSEDDVRIARLLAAAKPRFAPDSINRTSGHVSRTFAGVLSDEALSTTTISCEVAGTCCVSDPRTRSISRLEL